MYAGLDHLRRGLRHLVDDHYHGLVGFFLHHLSAQLLTRILRGLHRSEQTILPREGPLREYRHPGPVPI